MIANLGRRNKLLCITVDGSSRKKEMYSEDKLFEDDSWFGGWVRENDAVVPSGCTGTGGFTQWGGTPPSVGTTTEEENDDDDDEVRYVSMRACVFNLG